MKVVITGASGFIGGSFVRRWMAHAGAEDRILCLTSSDAGAEKLLHEWPHISVIPLRSVGTGAVMKAMEGADALFHCGWSTVPRTADADPAKDLLENVYNGLPLIDAAIFAGVRRFIFLSSGGTVYGHGSRPHREHDPVDPIGAYGISKFTFEQYLRDRSAGSSMRPLVLRPGNVYGRSSDPLRPQGVIEHWMSRVLHGQPVEIWGDTSVVRDYVHIDDLTRVMLSMMAHDGPQRIYNVGSGIGTTLEEILRMLEELSGTELTRIHHDKLNVAGPKVNILDPSLLSGELELQPSIPLKEGLRSLWDRSHQEYHPARR